MSELTNDDLNAVLSAYRADDSPTNAKAVRVFAIRFLKSQRDRGCALAGFGPTLAMLDVSSEAYKEGCTVRLAQWVIRRALSEDRPGWNDYWMTRWLLTGDLLAVREIHRRAAHLDGAKWSMVAETAQWMVSSVRQSDREFDVAYREVEAACDLCGVPA